VRLTIYMTRFTPSARSEVLSAATLGWSGDRQAASTLGRSTERPKIYWRAP